MSKGGAHFLTPPPAARVAAPAHVLAFGAAAAAEAAPPPVATVGGATAVQAALAGLLECAPELSLAARDSETSSLPELVLRARALLDAHVGPLLTPSASVPAKAARAARKVLAKL